MTHRRPTDTAVAIGCLYRDRREGYRHGGRQAVRKRQQCPPEPWTEQDTRDRGMRCLIAPHFLALSILIGEECHVEGPTCRVGDWRGSGRRMGVAVPRRLSQCRCLTPRHNSVSSRRSPNRTGGSPASGSPVGSCVSHMEHPGNHAQQVILRKWHDFRPAARGAFSGPPSLLTPRRPRA